MIQQPRGHGQRIVYGNGWRVGSQIERKRIIKRGDAIVGQGAYDKSANNAFDQRKRVQAIGWPETLTISFEYQCTALVDKHCAPTVVIKPRLCGCWECRRAL